MKKLLVLFLTAFLTSFLSFNAYAEEEAINPGALEKDSILSYVRDYTAKSNIRLTYNVESYISSRAEIKFGGQIKEEYYNPAYEYGVIVRPADDEASDILYNNLADQYYTDKLTCLNELKELGYVLPMNKVLNEQLIKDNNHGDGSIYTMAWVISNLTDNYYTFDASIYVITDNNDIAISHETTRSFNSLVDRYIELGNQNLAIKKALALLRDSNGDIYEVDKSSLYLKDSKEKLPSGKYLYAYSSMNSGNNTLIPGHYTMVRPDGSFRLNPHIADIVFVSSDNKDLEKAFSWSSDILGQTGNLNIIDYADIVSYDVTDALINSLISKNDQEEYDSNKPLYVYFFGNYFSEWVKLNTDSKAIITKANRNRYTSYILVQTKDDLPHWNSSDNSTNVLWQTKESFILEDRLGGNIFFKLTNEDILNALSWTSTDYTKDLFKVIFKSSKNPSLSYEVTLDDTLSFSISERIDGYDSAIIKGYSKDNLAMEKGHSEELKIEGNRLIIPKNLAKLTFIDGDNKYEYYVKPNEAIKELPPLGEKRGYKASWDISNEPITKDMTIYSKYDLITYNITYYLDGGECENKTTYTVLDSFILNNPTKPGYTFTAWRGDDIYSDSVKIENEIGDKSFYAYYNANSYTVSYFFIDDYIERYDLVKFGSSYTFPAHSKGNFEAVSYTLGDKEYKVGDTIIFDIPNDVTFYTKVGYNGGRYEYNNNNGKITLKKYYGDETYLAIPSYLKVDNEFLAVDTISSELLQYRDQVETIIICDGVRSIDEGAFYGLKKLTTVLLPKSLKSIGVYAFAMCSALNNINIENVMEFGHHAFAGCLALSYVELNDNITSITFGLFEASGLVEIKLPANLNFIEAGVFNNCNKLEKIVLPDSLYKIDYNAFSNCTSLKSIVINPFIELHEYVFAGCSSLTIYCLGDPSSFDFSYDFNPDNRPIEYIKKK